MKMNTVLAAIDFSPVSRNVLSTAIEIVRAIGGQLVVLNAVPPPAIVTDLAPLVGKALQLTADNERVSRRHLQRIQKRLAARGLPVEAICQQGFPLPLIVGQARKLQARYIVLGSHGHTAFYDLVAGSTASGVLKRAPCPVVVVPVVSTKRKRHNSRRVT